MDADVFSEKYLLEPLSISNYYWRKNEKDGIITAIGPLFLTPRDMAKLGQLFLDNGQWKGNQIISSKWVNEATTTFIGNESTASGYGYNWWTVTYSSGIRLYVARGFGGQYIFVIPSLNAVVVFTAGNFPPFNQQIQVGMLTNRILPAML